MNHWRSKAEEVSGIQPTCADGRLEARRSMSNVVNPIVDIEVWRVYTTHWWNWTC